MKHTAVSPEQRERLRNIRDALQKFGQESEDMQYFDTGEALHLMGEAYDAIDWLFTPTKPKQNRRN